MLCDDHPEITQYYEPGKEFVAFNGLDECADKARYYLTHEPERARIASAYFERTRAEHLWQHRFRHLLSDMGFPNS